MKHTHTHATVIPGRRNPERSNAVPVFVNDEPIVATDDAGANPGLLPDSDAFGRMVGNLATEDGGGAGDTRPTHAPLTATLEAEIVPEGIFRSVDGRLYAHGRIVSLAGAKVDVAGVGVYMEIDPAAPVGAVWGVLFRPAYPDGEG
jgi:hypothetical protein